MKSVTKLICRDLRRAFGLLRDRRKMCVNEKKGQ